MGILRRLFGVFKRHDNIPLDFKKSQGILIRPDGSWIVTSSNVNEPPKPAASPYAPPPIPPKVVRASTIPAGKDYGWFDTDSSELNTINFPPDYFPQASELYSKLEQCLELDIITSCIHKETKNNVYILAIELPCTKDHTENAKKFKLFVKAMEEMYKFKTIQQERINSRTCDDQYYLVVFEYDPKSFILKKLTETKENDTKN